MKKVQKGNEKFNRKATIKSLKSLSNSAWDEEEIKELNDELINQIVV